MPTLLGRLIAGVCLALIMVGAAPMRAVWGGAPLPSGQQFTYEGAHGPGAGGGSAQIPSYTLAYPAGWTVRQWPDTLAGYGQLSLWSPQGTTIELIILPLRPHGPTLTDLIAHDLSFLPQATRDTVKLPLGRAVRLSGSARGSGMATQILFVRHGRLVYRFFSTQPLRSDVTNPVASLAAHLRIPAVPGAPPGIFPPPVPHGSGGPGCCRCPVAGAGWGTVLTRLDGVPVYSNAGDINNGCVGKSGILYQCVELVQRYYTQRWGYPPIWAGVEGAADMTTHHPDGIMFIPNGGSPGPREGDAVLFYGGTFGHVAVVRKVDRRKGFLDIVEENWSPTGEARLEIFADNTIAIRDSAFGSYTVAGWLHSPLNGTKPSA